MIKVPQQQIPGIYHRRVGDIVVTAISDGFLDGALDGLDRAARKECLAAGLHMPEPGGWNVSTVERRFGHERQCVSGIFGRPARPDRNRIGQLLAADGRQGDGQPQGSRC